MAQSYQPGTIPQMARTDGHGGSRPPTGDIQAGDRPKTSGFYERGPAAEGGWGFVLPRENGTIDVIAARNAAVIGSSEDADVQILGPEVAPQHARVEVRADGVYLEDLESPGGTFVGGVRARRIGMAHGDIVRFGNQLAVFVEHGLVRYKGRIDLGEPLVIGPRDRSAFVDPALDYARSGQSFVIEGGPGLGKRTLAQMAAGQRAEQGPLVTVDAGDAPAEAFADAREEQPATWILVNAERLPRAVQVEVGQILARTPGSIAIATLETPLDRALGDSLVAPGFATIFNGRRLTIPPLSARRENIPGIVWSLARKLGIGASRISVELIERIARAAWPGGIAEIEEVLLDTANKSIGTLDAASISRPLTRPPSVHPSPPAADDPALARERLVDALAKANGSIASAARTLGMSRQAVYREAQRLGLEVGKRRAASR
jgi:pSer/pThr/pTyr-binding forkhead associated (FHA) protein